MSDRLPETVRMLRDGPPDALEFEEARRLLKQLELAGFLRMLSRTGLPADIDCLRWERGVGLSRTYTGGFCYKVETVEPICDDKELGLIANAMEYNLENVPHDLCCSADWFAVFGLSAQILSGMAADPLRYAETIKMNSYLPEKFFLCCCVLGLSNGRWAANLVYPKVFRGEPAGSYAEAIESLRKAVDFGRVNEGHFLVMQEKMVSNYRQRQRRRRC
ncbi:MAG: hypothetical protein BWY43_00293 [candidate division WS2 bacterium ADurb.Bin280]|uniref:Uncharacterized protein n=1 Tax=candidate division WS2 bacterium ADurb.Bin280 TaxID=1852829 RepID=A0A1V5SFW1_9BACT|nr:MAG: hypothetical protein BWY43_00293 [candidate division WS2 bacterium ADurb.Bin280]